MAHGPLVILGRGLEKKNKMNKRSFIFKHPLIFLCGTIQATHLEVNMFLLKSGISVVLQQFATF